MKKNKENINPAVPELLTVAPSPHIKVKDNTASVMIDVIIALAPALVWGIITFGTRAALITVISILSCVGAEALSQKLMKRKITVSDMSAVVTGLLIALNLPVSVPLWMPVVGGVFAIVIVKQLFGGIGKNIVNPALAARVFLFSWADNMTRFTGIGQKVNSFAISVSESDIVASATPLKALKEGTIPGVSVTDSFLGNVNGCIGEVSSVLLIIGGIYLLVKKVITWHIPVSYILTVAVITYIFPQTSNSLQFMSYEIVSGGLILGALFMATDYATSPLTARGRIIYGIGCGAITVLIRYFGGYNEGVSFAILIMNLLVWYLDLAGMPRRFGEKGKLAKKKDA